MEVIEVLALVGKILCFVIGGALFIGAAAALLLNGLEVEAEERRLKAEFSLTFVIPTILSLIPYLNYVIPIAYLVLAIFYWSRKEEDMARIRKNWGELVAVRNALFAGVALIVLGVLLLLLV